MPFKALVSLIFLPVLAACVTPGPSEEVLADACQLKPCSCVEIDGGGWLDPETKPLLWRQTGEAYCPEGYRLQRDDSEQ